jgi:hypothetical protein
MEPRQCFIREDDFYYELKVIIDQLIRDGERYLGNKLAKAVADRKIEKIMKWVWEIPKHCKQFKKDEIDANFVRMWRVILLECYRCIEGLTCEQINDILVEEGCYWQFYDEIISRNPEKERDYVYESFTVVEDSEGFLCCTKMDYEQEQAEIESIKIMYGERTVKGKSLALDEVFKLAYTARIAPKAPKAPKAARSASRCAARSTPGKRRLTSASSPPSEALPLELSVLCTHSDSPALDQAIRDSIANGDCRSINPFIYDKIFSLIAEYRCQCCRMIVKFVTGIPVLRTYTDKLGYTIMQRCPFCCNVVSSINHRRIKIGEGRFIILPPFYEIKDKVSKIVVRLDDSYSRDSDIYRYHTEVRDRWFRMNRFI